MDHLLSKEKKGTKKTLKKFRPKERSSCLVLRDQRKISQIVL